MSAITNQYMLKVHPRRMQGATRHLRDMFFPVIVLSSSWLLTNADTNPTTSLKGTWTPPPVPSHLQTIRTIPGTSITYRLDTWSQYDNPEEGTKREGDIDQLLSHKTITTNRNLLWPNAVVNYYIDTSIASAPAQLAILENAITTIMSSTCIQFVRVFPDENGVMPPGSWVNMTAANVGCQSALGRNPTGASILNLNIEDCFDTVGHALHEILHTLGVFHEHMRPDRNQYVTIIWENIKPGNEYNFVLLNETGATAYGLPYDYNSIMHYSMTAFSIDKTRPTIIPVDPNAEIGQRYYLSELDIRKLLIAYNCGGAKTVI